jgi:hypothetical protein
MKNIQETKESKLPENTDRTVKKQGQFKKGDPRINREGRPLGTKNFATDFDEVVQDIAKANKITISEARKILFRRAYSEAKDGNFPYYKDIMDRYYGKAKDYLDMDIKSKGASLVELYDRAKKLREGEVDEEG